ncbi:DUF983 domain-containing protein [Salipiger sp. 1_MG-2023]|uniref:DUF983 domain-containing protein n=1 Tax=Salipiger sp. 1_MG-2023 TaxID=3062665 RepID=UPI0026E4424F|nr:DUF983 domain-containing protein [Salipiger sp. 1_MG-2023]MDO6588270.1 DUF983 domain-containing protein [Salipiger sp. 1_MG-2023]
MTDQPMTSSDDPAEAPLDGAPRLNTPDAPAERPTWPSVWKGLRKRCPNCGNGPLLRGYLKVRDHCPVCREPLHHHRADDGPAYLTILLVGHAMAPALHIGFVVWRPEPLILLTVLGTGATALTLFLLPRLKGAIIAFQWARRMHGFSQTETT